MDNTVKYAMDTIRHQLKDDDSYAHSWHCNLAMMYYDAARSDSDVSHQDAHRVGNDAATRFMQLCFNKHTTNDMLVDVPLDDSQRERVIVANP